MQKTLKKRLPIIYSWIHIIYMSTGIYKQKIINIEATNKAVKASKHNIQLDYMSKVFNNSFMVHNGPFKGMQYIDNSSGSALLPKILGSYEEPIQDWILEVIRKNYETIIDIGCAEGYYAVGFGMRMPDTEIIAYDIDEEAKANLYKLMKLNRLDNIKIRSECTFGALNSLCKKNTLVFCDIEGFEKTLLDPNRVPNLKYVDLIVESHDCFYPNLTELLINRFYKTHTIKMVLDYPLRMNKYHTPNTCSIHDLHEVQNEDRPPAMRFLYMKSVDEKL